MTKYAVEKQQQDVIISLALDNLKFKGKKKHASQAVLEKMYKKGISGIYEVKSESNKSKEKIEKVEK